MAAETPASRRSPQRLPASRRIRSRGDFARARAEGQRIVQGCLILNWMKSPEPPARCTNDGPGRQRPLAVSRLGVITSRKIGKAVTRSRSRRLLREVFRLHQHDLAQPVDIILVARPSIAGRQRQAVERDYLSALGRCGLLKSRTAPPSGASPEVS